MKIDKEELHAIFNGIANDDETQFSMLYEKYNKLVYQVAFSILKNKENSEDVTQKVFLKIWKLDKEKLPTCSEASWLYSLSKNESLNYLRSKKEELDIEDIYYIVEENEELNKLIDKDTYNRTISRLNSDEQEIVSLRVLSNLSFREIAKMLNIPIGTAQWKYYKSMNTLKGLIVNCSIFIITIGLFLSERRVRNGKESSNVMLGVDNENDIEQKVNKVEIANNEEVDRKQQNQTKNAANNTDSTKENTKGEIQSNNIYNNEIVNNIVSNMLKESNTTGNNIVEKNEITQQVIDNSNQIRSLNALEIGTLVVSAVFFVFTLIYLCVFIKGRGKEKKGK